MRGGTGESGVTRPAWVRGGGFLCAAVLLAGPLLGGPAAANVRSQALYARGLIPYNNGQWAQALRLFDQAVRADPHDAAALYYRGLTRARQGSTESAIDDLRQALKLDPTLPHAPLDLGIAYFDTGQYAEARRWLERARERNIERFTAAFFLGLTLYRVGDDAGALSNLQEAEMDPALRPAARYYAGLALLRQGKVAAGRAQLAQAAQEQPQSQIGQAARSYSSAAAALPPGVAKKPWALYAQLSLAYDSNVVAGPSDSVVNGQTGISGKSDGAALMGFGGRYTLLERPAGSLQAGYDFFQSVHFRLNDFDLQAHSLHLEATSKPGVVTYGLAGAYDFYALNYQSFYHEVLGTPWVAVAEGNAAASELYYTVRGRDFFRGPYDPYRDGINHAVGVREYLALGNSRRVLGFGYQFDSENPISNGPGGRDFRYDGQQLDVGLTLPVLDLVRLQLAYLFRLEDYRYINSRPNRDGSSVRRHDADQQFVIDVAHDLSTHLAVTLAYIGVIDHSNIVDFEYTRNLVSAGVRVSF
jgi:tetratricopeptide (TPR) repeat protein